MVVMHRRYDRQIRAAGPIEGALVVGYAAPPEHAFTAALARLCAALGLAPGAAAEAGSKRKPVEVPCIGFRCSPTLTARSMCH
jgi:hypothetical protein